jgi:hypothetical protein
MPDIDLRTVPGILPDEPKPEVSGEKPAVKDEVPSEEESKVPYKRFKKFHDAALEAEKEAAYWRGIAEGRENQPTKVEAEEVPQDWLDTYGDTPVAKRLWKLDQERREELYRTAQEKALEALRAERENESQALESNLETIDEHLESVSEVAGRPLSEKEESELLDAIDFLTPKNRDGSYAGPLAPAEAAWAYVQATQGAAQGTRKVERNAVAGLSNAGSQGEPSSDARAERNKNFNPLDWNSWMPKQ